MIRGINAHPETKRFKMLNIVVPMAGAGRKFASAGYKDPKPLIRVGGVPMSALVIENIRPSRDHRFIFVIQESHHREYGLSQILCRWAGEKSQIVRVDGLTENVVRTVLAAKKLINNENPLMIAGGDQWVDVKIDDYLETADYQKDGLTMTVQSGDPGCSFVQSCDGGIFGEVIRKQESVNFGTVGIYYFSRGSDFVTSALEMIDDGSVVNRNLSIAPVCDWLIERGGRVGSYSVGSVGNGIYRLGNPADLELFLRLPVSKKALQPFEVLV